MDLSGAHQDWWATLVTFTGPALLFVFGQRAKDLIAVAEPTGDIGYTFNATATRGTGSLQCPEPRLQGHCNMFVYVVKEVPNEQVYLMFPQVASCISD